MADSITVTGDQTSMLSTQNTFNLANMFSKNLMKGKFVEILKQVDDHQLFELLSQP